LKGFETACSIGAEMVIFTDGDGSDDPADLLMMVRPIREGQLLHVAYNVALCRNEEDT